MGTTLSLPFYDGFAPIFALGVGGGSGSIWTLGTPSTNITVATSLSLSDPALQATPAGSGVIAVMPSTAQQDMGVSFSPITSGPVYASFLLQIGTSPTASTNLCIAGLDGRTTYANSPELTIGLNPSDELVVGRRSATTVSSATPPLTPGQTYLVVVRYNFVTGTSNDTIDLWLNPANLGVAESNVPPATIAGYSNPALTDATNLQAFYIVSPATGAGGQWFISSVRIGTTWAQVTPADAPVATISLPDNATPSFMYLTGGNTVQFTVAATDQNGNLQTTQWYLNGVLQQSDTNMSGFSGVDNWTHTFTAMGTNIVQAVVGNTAGALSSPSATWTVAFVPSQRGMYVDELTSVLGNVPAEESILQYALNTNITYLALYVSQSQLNSTLSSFIQLAKSSYGIQQIGLIGQNTNDFNGFITYNNTYTNRGDVLNLEYEYWNQTPRDFTGYINRLQYMRRIAAAQALKVEAYVGYPSNSEMPIICGLVDRLFVHCYVTNPNTAYTYAEPQYLRWYSAGLATNRPTLWPIFSCESSGNYSDQPFMGDWLAADSLNLAESIFMNSYASDTNVLKYNAAILGFQYFSYDFMSPLLFLTANSFSPTNQTTNVVTNSSFVITMNTNVVKGATGNVTIKQASDNAIFQTIPVTDSRISVSGAQVTINPGATFPDGIAYYILVDPTCFKSSAGAYFPGISVTNGWTFTTR